MLNSLKSGMVWVLGSIRGRILLLLLVTIVPLVGERVRGLEVGRQDRIRFVSDQLHDLASEGLVRQQQLLDTTAALLRTIAATAPHLGDTSDCGRLLNAIGNPLPSLFALQIASPDGQVVCSNRTETLGINVADRDYFRETVANGAPVVSDVLIGRATSSPTVIVAQPLPTPDGRIAVLFAALHLNWVSSLVGERISNSDTVAFIMNGNGMIVSREPLPLHWRGRSVADHDLFGQLRTHTRPFTATDFDGVRRIFGATRLNAEDTLLVVGVRESDVLQNINRHVYVAYGILSFVTLSVLIAALFGSDRFIVRPIRALVGMASAVGRGDYEAGRTSMKVPAEFRPLLGAIRSMATRLQDREAAMKRTNERLGWLAQVDALTGLGNRGCFDARLVEGHADAALRKDSLALLLVDVDHFKAFNDHYGHVAGDACLRAVAKAIAGAVRDCDFAARYGGEEFVVLGRAMDAGAAIAVAERLNKAVRALGIPHERSPHRLVTISIGIAMAVPQEGELPERLVEEADAALYTAKKQGRDRIATSADVLALAG